MPDFSFYHFNALPGTNAAAKEYPAYSVITADTQTAGKGRRGHTWISPAGNLYASVVLPSPKLCALGIFSICVAISLSESLPIANNIKWPNDILINGKKVCGILIESGQSDCIVIGIGANVTTAPDIKSDYPATSLAAQNCTITPKDLLNGFLTELQKNLSLPADKIIRLFKQKAIGIGHPIKVSLVNQTLFGVFKDIDADGSLILSPANPNAADKIIPYGDIFLIK